MLFREQLQHALGYTVDRELTGGGMARVFVARDERLGREIVVKTIAPELAGSVNAERFQREIAIAARLQHPHIVPLLDAGDIGGIPYYTMPLVEGDSLRHRLNAGELSISETIAILRDVAKALEHAHRKGVVHRDVKPDNVLLSGHSASVTDFGVAKALASSTRGDDLTGVGIALGTPAYMAPEQGAGDANVDARADIYAFGVMAYEMLAGHLPFPGRTASQLAAAHAVDTPTPIERLRPTVPPELALLVARCLEKRPGDRPASASELVKELESIPVSGAGRPVARGSRGRPAIVAVVVIVAAAVGALIYARQSTLNTRRFAVMPFANLTGDTQFANLGGLTAYWVMRGIQQTDSGEAIAPGNLPASGNKAGIDAARDAARRVRAGTVITGAIYRRGDSLYFNAQINDVASGRLALAVENVAGPVSDMMVGLDTLRQRLMSATSVTDSRSTAHLIATEAPKYEAYNTFMQGVERFGHLDDARAIPILQRAIAQDSSFGSAYVWLIASYSNIGRHREGDSLLSVARRHEASMTAIDRKELALFEAYYRGTAEQKLAISNDLARRDSNTLFLYWVGLHANESNRPALAARALEWIGDIETITPGWSPYWSGLASAYHGLNDYKKELALSRTIEHYYPNALATRTRALAALGRFDEVSRVLDSLAKNYADTAVDPAGYWGQAGVELRAHGHVNESRTAFNNAIAWEEAHPDVVRRRRAWQSSSAQHYIDVDRFDQARSILAPLVAADSTRPLELGRLGVVEAHLGHRAAALHADSTLAAINNPYSFGEPEYQRATIAAALGDKLRAVQLLKQGLAKGLQFGLRWHTDRELRTLHGVAAFDAMVAPKG